MERTENKTANNNIGSQEMEKKKKSTLLSSRSSCTKAEIKIERENSQHLLLSKGQNVQDKIIAPKWSVLVTD